MAYKNLVRAEMSELTASWIDPDDPANIALLGSKHTAGLMSDLQEAQNSIFSLRPRAEETRLNDIKAQAEQLDQVHDVAARGIYHFLTSSAILDDDGEALITLRDYLIPAGLRDTLQASYRAQAGSLASLRERLTEPVKAQLRALPLRRGTLFDSVLAWLDAGDRLGKLEETRDRLEKATPSLGSQVTVARNKWIRVVSAVVTMADFAGFDEETHRVVFGPLLEAERKADLRAARRSAKSMPNTQPPPALAADESPEADVAIGS